MSNTTENNEIQMLDFTAIERQARQLRAEATHELIKSFKAWIARRAGARRNTQPA